MQIRVTNFVSTVATSSINFSLSKNERLALNISLCVGVVMLGTKWFAYMITGSVAIFSDAMESVVHQFAVAFAWYSLRVTYRPPDKDHHYGHDKITYFSAGLEGGLIIVAAFVIIGEAIHKLIIGITLEQISFGTSLTAGAGLINTVLGYYLKRIGKKEKSLIVEANGRHILTDAWTSFGAVVGLLLAWKTGLYIIDPILALLFGSNIIFEGLKLMRSAVQGLMDHTNDFYENKARAALETFCFEHHISFHRQRLRESGQRVYVDFHIVFPDGTPIETAHQFASEAEQCVVDVIDHPSEVMSHLESEHLPEGHDE